MNEREYPQVPYKFYILTSDAVRAVRGMTDEFVEWDYLTHQREGKVRSEDFSRWMQQNEAELTQNPWEAEAIASVIRAEYEHSLAKR